MIGDNINFDYGLSSGKINNQIFQSIQKPSFCRVFGPTSSFYWESFFFEKSGPFKHNICLTQCQNLEKTDPIPRKCLDGRTRGFYFIRPFRLQPGVPQKNVHFFWKPHCRLKEWQARWLKVDFQPHNTNNHVACGSVIGRVYDLEMQFFKCLKF